MIDLYIEGEHIDLENDVEIDITYDSFDTQKLTAVKNSFSKTLNIPGTPNNNKVFGHIFRNDKNIPGVISGHCDYDVSNPNDLYRAANIPEDITLLEYIDSTGQESIATLFYPNQDTQIEMKYKLLPDAPTTYSQVVLGCANAAYATNAGRGIVRFHRGINTSLNRVGFGNGENTTTNISGYNSFDEEYTLRFNKNIIYINGNYVVTLPTPNTTWTASYNLHLFSRNTQGIPRYNSKMRLWYCKIWDDETLAQHWVPARRNSDNEIGLYDVVSKVFRKNFRSEGGFIPGPEIPRPVYPINSNYDPHRRINWIINQNGSLVNRGYCTLDNIVVEENNRKVTYKITLYGGLGEFLYSLQYNEDGTPKTLVDMYYQWRPKIGLNQVTAPMTPTEELSNVIYECTPQNVAHAWHTLKPTNTYSGPTEIDKDVVFVPVYTGLYNDFDSKHMLVTTDNYTNTIAQQYLSDDNKNNILRSFPPIITETVDNETHTYESITKDYNESNSAKYGLVTFSRDVDPSEAGEMRISELPVAIRLAKLMEVISQPENNGGYEVEWDSEITESDYWLYGWLILGKLNNEKFSYDAYTLTSNETIDGKNINFTYDQEITYVTQQGGYGNNIQLQNQSLNSIDDIPVLKYGKYNIKLNVIPKFTITSSSGGVFTVPTSQIATKYKISSRIFHTQYQNIGGQSTKLYQYIWTTPVLVHVITGINQGSAVRNTQNVYADAFFFTNDDTIQFGTNNENVSYNDICNTLKDELAEQLTESILEDWGFIENIDIHNCKCKPIVEGDDPNIVGHYVNPNDYDYLYAIDYECDNERISHVFETPTYWGNEADLLQVQVKQYQIVMYTVLEKYLDTDSNSVQQRLYSGIWGANGANVINNFPILGHNYDPTIKLEYSDNMPIGKVPKTMFEFSLGYGYTGYPTYGNAMSAITGVEPYFNFSFTMNSDKNNTLTPAYSVGEGYIKMTKELLFANSSSPMKYMLDFIKMMNLKISADNITKKINIDTIRNYYKTYDDNDIKTNAIVDYSRPIEIKTVLTDARKLIFGLDTPETYAVNVFNRLSTEKFNQKEYDTGIEYISLTKNILNDLTYKNTMDWQLSSVFFNDYGQLPKAYCAPTVSWTLFDIDALDNEELVKKEFILPGVKLPTMSASYDKQDTIPKLSMFNNEGKTMEINDTFVFLSGFIKNYDYTLYKTEYVDETHNNYYYAISPRNLLTYDTLEQYALNDGKRCYEWNFCYNDIFEFWGCYSRYNNTYATAWAMPYFSRDLRIKYGPRYGLYDPWWGEANRKLTSWNVIRQDSLYDLIDFKDTKFICDVENENFFPKTIVDLNVETPNQHSATWQGYEYSYSGYFDITNADTNLIYDIYWQGYLDELYNKNSRQVTLYMDLTKFSSANDILRTIFKWEGQYWIVKKIFNYKISDIYKDRFTKVTLHKITNINNWIA